MNTQKVTFKPYNQTQLYLLPPSLDELISKDHPVRVVNEVINKINIDCLVEAYQVSGCSSYHPQMMLKVIVFGYLSNVYSSRKLEGACKENINFMWLSGMNQPDHNTLNRFRSLRLKDALKNVFNQVVLLLAEEGLLSIDQVYTDGTKIEAYANKYTFVWKKSIQHHKERMRNQLTEIWKYAQSVAQQEEELPDPPDFKQIDPNKVQSAVDSLNKVLKNKAGVPAKTKAKLRYITKHYPVNIEKYQKQEKILGSRNSYSKTDVDATFMRMKEDAMKNGQLKAGYNIQISTSNQFIVNYTVHPNPTDTTTLESHLKQHKLALGKFPQQVTADAGYGSEENYDFLHNNKIEAFIKYNTFDKEQKSKTKYKDTFKADYLHYNQEQDCYICPMGQKMHYIGESKRKTSTGFEQTLRRYQPQNCSHCPLNGICQKSKHNRIIEVNFNLNTHRLRVKKLLNSEEGRKKRKKRGYDVETVFGNIKQNHGFRRFMLRGKEKVAIEWGLLAIEQNIRKKIA